MLRNSIRKKNNQSYIIKKTNLPKLAIIGAGSIGQLYYHQISRCKLFDIFFCDTRKNINNVQITNFIQPKRTIRKPAKILALKNISQAQIILITTKTYNLIDVCQDILPYLNPNAEIIILTNGMGIQQQASNLLKGFKVYFATTTNGAIHNKFTSIHKGLGNTYIGKATKCNNFISPLLNLLCNAIPNTKFVRNINLYLLQKLAVNAIINPLTAFYKCKNGELSLKQNEIKILCKELAPIINTLGLPITSDYIFQKVMTIVHITAENYSSMEQDYLYNRQSEIEYILGFVVNIANKHEIEIPNIKTIYAKLS